MAPDGRPTRLDAYRQLSQVGVCGARDVDINRTIHQPHRPANGTRNSRSPRTALRSRLNSEGCVCLKSEKNCPLEVEKNSKGTISGCTHFSSSSRNSAAASSSPNPVISLSGCNSEARQFRPLHPQTPERSAPSSIRVLALMASLSTRARATAGGRPVAADNRKASASRSAPSAGGPRRSTGSLRT